ncbi:hypothetical protein PMAYCL1PPCAC_21722, partial [Pristionchus mayeri]
ILQKTIFFYSTGLSRKGEQAIAFTLLNRWKANREEFGGRNIADICLQLWENARPEEVELPENVQKGMNKWLPLVWNGNIYDITKGALYFKFPDENDYWTKGMDKTASIKNIEFYKD